MHESLKISRIFWLTQSLLDVPEHDDWLSHRERALLSRMRFPKRRTEWRLGRWTAKCALLRLVNVADVEVGVMEPLHSMKDANTDCGTFDQFSKIEIIAAADGAPESFWNDEPLPIGLSISHRNEIGFCAISTPSLSVGCDLEAIEPRSDTFVADYFSSHEQEIVMQAALPERPRIATLIWSAKESALKALRQGLRLDTRWVEVDFPSEVGEIGNFGEWHPLTVRYVKSDQTFRGWWRRQPESLQTVIATVPIAQPIALSMRV